MEMVREGYAALLLLLFYEVRVYMSGGMEGLDDNLAILWINVSEL